MAIVFGDVRFRGRIGTCEEDNEYKGKFFFELSIWDVAGTEMCGEPFGPVGPFDTQQEAGAALKEVIRFASEKIVKEMGGKSDGKYFDLKNGGILRDWDEH